MIRILLADDHAIVRTGLRRILESEFRETEIGEAATCGDLLEKVAAGRWDLVILDVSMAGQNSLRVLPELRARRPDLPVVVLSMYSERQFVIQALTAGAFAYLSKERAPEELFSAIHAVMAGRRYIGESLAEQLADYVALDRAGQAHEALSPREFEVFLLLAGGKPVTHIAQTLSLSVKTVSTYRTRILEKMMMGSNAELIQYAVRHGLTG